MLLIFSINLWCAWKTRVGLGQHVTSYVTRGNKSTHCDPRISIRLVRSLVLDWITLKPDVGQFAFLTCLLNCWSQLSRCFLDVRIYIPLSSFVSEGINNRNPLTAIKFILFYLRFNVSLNYKAFLVTGFVFFRLVLLRLKRRRENR